MRLTGPPDATPLNRQEPSIQPAPTLAKKSPEINSRAYCAVQLRALLGKEQARIDSRLDDSVSSTAETSA
jgi:hypothetical protein